MSKFGLNRILKNFNQLKHDLPERVANDGQRFFSKSFRDQGFTDENLVKWKARRRSRRNRKNQTKPILVQRGRLRREVANSVKKVSFEEILFQVSAPYAKIHNEGGVIHKKAGRANFKIHSDGRSRFARAKNANFQQDTRAHDITIPQRKFMGNSRTLTRNIRKRISDALKTLKR
ncbi:Phage virion morphogensis protein [uncultured Caudovirales phage]|uniref:Phage virion morphogensis protein n=1 Tax=uncultured Caudovirales phage TaxID=2100421 RepID=A0A6J5STU3_9CAUD|nr:Phage virion morphogensis protein [uncultured Caudovirales phage]